MIPDLSPYKSGPDKQLGYEPLAVGWLQRNQPFATGATPAEFRAKLLAFCVAGHTVNEQRHTSRCAVGADCPRVLPAIEQEGETVHLGFSEIRVIGQEEIYAAPTLIYHYVTAHNYRPPDEFIQALLHGPQPGSPEHQALVKTLNSY